MITLFGDGISTRFTKPMRDCRVFATDKNELHKAGEFLGIVLKVEGNLLHVKNKGETDIYVWRFASDRKNEWIEFGV